MKATEEELQSVLEMTVVLIDGYHRIKAIWIIKNDPESLLDPELGIDWQVLPPGLLNWGTTPSATPPRYIKFKHTNMKISFSTTTFEIFPTPCPMMF